MSDYDVLILGGGIAGLSTAWHLARAGAERVVLLERERALGTRASGENAAILRTFGPDPVTNAIATASGAFLRSPPRGFAPYPLVDERGLLLLAGADTQRDLRALADGERPDAALLEPEAWKARAPHVHAPTKTALAFGTDGRIDVAAELDAFARGARAGGVELRTGTEVAELELESGGTRVGGIRLTSGERLRARRTVLAAGGWAGRIGARAGSPVTLRPTRRHLLVTAADASVDPDWPVVWIEDEGFYCRPESGGLLISACDTVDADPDRYANDPAALEWIAAKAERFLPAFGEAGAAHLWCGLRTLSADDRFALGPDPTLEGLFWVAGLGGHGMTCGPEVGRLASVALLDTARAARDAQLLDALAPARLAAPGHMRAPGSGSGDDTPGARPATQSVGA